MIATLQAEIDSQTRVHFSLEHPLICSVNFVLNLFKQQAIDGFSGISSWLFFYYSFVIISNSQIVLMIVIFPETLPPQVSCSSKAGSKLCPLPLPACFKWPWQKASSFSLLYFFSNLVLAKGFRFHSSHLTQFEPCPKGNV